MSYLFLNTLGNASGVVVVVYLFVLYSTLNWDIPQEQNHLNIPSTLKYFG